MKLIVGLGNPGGEYERTRHNVGFMAIDALVNEYDICFHKEKFGGIYAETTIDEEKYVFLKPLRYINLSGEVIRKYADFYKVSISDILIIHDDMDIPLGHFKIKHQGSSAGHNGLKNIQMHLGTSLYKRIKIGISRNINNDYKDYVLGKLSNNDFEIVNSVIEKIKLVFKDYQKMDFMNLMSKYNNN